MMSRFVTILTTRTAAIPALVTKFTTRMLIAALIALPLVKIVTSGTAQALDCLVPTFGEVFNRLQREAHGKFLVALGQLNRDNPAPDITERETGRLLFTFSGVWLTRAGPLPVPAAEVTFTSHCMGPWCGPVYGHNARTLMFVDVAFPETPGNSMQRGNGPKLSIDSYDCPGRASIPDPRPDHIAAVEACLQKGRCGEEEISILAR